MVLPPCTFLFAIILSLLSLRRVPAFQSLANVLRLHHNPPIPIARAQTVLSMVRGVKKEHLPEKVCIVCHRPFTWRKKWESCWDEVTTCSKSCNRQRRAAQQEANRAARGDEEQEEEETKDQSHDSNKKTKKDRSLKKHSVASASELEGAADTTKDEDNDEEEEEDMMMTAEAALDTDRETARLLLEGGNPMDHLVSTTDAEDDDPKKARKLAKKQMKTLRRLKRQGLAPEHGQKPCHVCQKSSDLLIRCTIDATEEWKMVCGTCWKSVSGGVVDGDADHPHYRYGGLWKNRAKRS